MQHPGELTPPDDTGSVTFQRFRYQAHVAFPYILACGLGDDISSVVFEHVEDIVLECRAKWRFLQVKTRDPGRPAWRLSDLLADGGAFHSLYRSYRAVSGLPISTSHEAFLEGPANARDQIQLLSAEAGRTGGELDERIGSALGIPEAEVHRFLERVRVRTNLPTRRFIADANLRSLGSQAPHLPMGTLETIYSNIIKAADDAIAAELARVPWEEMLDGRDTQNQAARALFEAKRLSHELIVSLMGPVTGAVRPLLRRLVDSDGPPPTVLEQKLLSGGATPEIVRHAQGMRAKATILATQFSSATFGSELDYIDDINERLLVIVDGLRAEHSSAVSPAVMIWNSLIDRLPGLVDAVDLRRVFRGDPYMLLGHICELADQCSTDWGQARA